VLFICLSPKQVPLVSLHDDEPSFFQKSERRRKEKSNSESSSKDVVKTEFDKPEVGTCCSHLFIYFKLWRSICGDKSLNILEIEIAGLVTPYQTLPCSSKAEFVFLF